MIFLRVARRVWGLYTRLFRVVSIPCDLRAAKDAVGIRDGWGAIGVDPQLDVHPIATYLPPGWYRLSYDAYHPSGDALFVPKIYPKRTLEQPHNFEILYPKGYGENNKVGIFLKTLQKELKSEQGQASKEGIEQQKSEDSTLPVPRDTSNQTRDSKDDASVIDSYPYTSPETTSYGHHNTDNTSSKGSNSDTSTPTELVINLRPHLPGQTRHLFRYTFEPEGFRFDPFDMDYPKTWQPYHGPFQLNNFRLTFLGAVPALLFSIYYAIARTERRWRLQKSRTALQLLRKKGKLTLMNWLAHKAYLKIQPPFSPTSWYRFFCDPACFDTSRIDWFSDLNRHPTFCLFLLVGEADPKQLSNTIQAVLSQSYPFSEIFILSSNASHPETTQQVARLVKKHPSIREIPCPLEAFGQALREAKSELICLIEAGDLLRNQALARLAREVADHEADIVYGDEVVLTESGDRVRKVVLRPAFCLDHFLNHPCIGLMTAIRRSLITNTKSLTDCKSIEALNEKLILDVLVRAKKIVHLPDLIFERLTRHGTPLNRRLPPSTISRFLEHQGFTYATVNATASEGLYSIRYNRSISGKTAIIMPTKNNGEILEIAVEALERTIPEELYDLVIVNHESDDSHTLSILRSITKKHRVIDYQGNFNFSKINNFAVKQLAGVNDSFLFMNNDVEAISPGWFESMRDKLGRKEVGIVGATLLYPPEIKTYSDDQESLFSDPKEMKLHQLKQTLEDGGTYFDEVCQYRIQHAGVMMHVGIAEHYLKFEEYEDKYVRDSATNPAVPAPVTRSFSAVTAACMMTRRDVFEEIGNFDETLAVGFQDVDLCLRAGNAGYKVLCDAEAVLFHHESMSRSTDDFLNRDPHPEDTSNFQYKYQHDIGRDPFYHPMLANSTPEYRPLRSLNQSRFISPRVVTNLGLTPYEAQTD